MFEEYDYFLLIAEELNISKAAKRAYTSQQSLSKYLKRLEKEHGALLFTRKPRFALTPAGEIVLQRARQMKTIAANMQTELEEIKANNGGRISFAASPGRAMTLLPIIFPVFNKRYPQVEVTVTMGMTDALLPQVTNGAIDVLLGVQPTLTTQLTEVVLHEEIFYIAASDELLMKYFQEDYPDCKLRFAKGVDLNEFAHVPFMQNTTASHSKTLVNNYLQQKGLKLNDILEIDDCETQLKIAQQGCAACFFPAMLKRALQNLNKENPNRHLNYYPLKDNHEFNRVSIVYQGKRRLPPYMKYFISLLKEQYETNYLDYPTE